MHISNLRSAFQVCAVGALLLVAGCARFGEFAKDRADRAAYSVIAGKQEQALGETRPFALDGSTSATLQSALAGAGRINLADDAYTTPAYTISLADAIAIAIANNRDYRTARERLFSQALGLTDVRWNYGAIFDASGAASYTRNESAAGVEEFGTESFAAGVRKQLATGAEITLGFTHQFVHLFSAGSNPGANNALSFDIVQPLLRGAGSLVAREPLTQAERDMIYAVRNFDRFEQAFAIDVVSRYYALLRALDQTNNARANLKSVSANHELLQIQVKNRVRSQLDADQAYQNVLQAEALRIDAQSAYESQLDQFKIFLGVPLDADIGPDRRELDDLRARGLIRPDMTLAAAIDAGLAGRLDYRNGQDQLEDAKRRSEIALRNFLPSLDAHYNFTTTDQRDHSAALDFRDHSEFWGLDLGLPLDWTPRRNDWRNALLAVDQAQRGADAQHDQVIADVRQGWRELDRLGRRVQIAQESVQLAERRVEGTQMMLAAGQTTAREMTDTQNELLDAQNALTSVLIDDTLSRLQFWRAIGRLKLNGALETGASRSPASPPAP